MTDQPTNQPSSQPTHQEIKNCIILHQCSYLLCQPYCQRRPISLPPLHHTWQRTHSGSYWCTQLQINPTGFSRQIHHTWWRLQIGLVQVSWVYVSLGLDACAPVLNKHNSRKRHESRRELLYRRIPGKRFQQDLRKWHMYEVWRTRD